MPSYNPSVCVNCNKPFFKKETAVKMCRCAEPRPWPSNPRMCDGCSRPIADKPKHPTEAERRKAQPLFSGVLAYFPDALLAVAECSRAGNEQHNPGMPLHWDRSKSADELEALSRHLLDLAKGVLVDTDGQSHLAKVAWRALAQLQKQIEVEKGIFKK